MKTLMPMILMFVPIVAISAPPPIDHPDYVKTSNAIAKMGKNDFMASVVGAQNKMMAEAGGELKLDQYNAVVRVYSLPNIGFMQWILINEKSMIADFNKRRKKEGKAELSHKDGMGRIRPLFMPGGKLRAGQINLLCTVPEFRAQLDGGISHEYKYFDSNMNNFASLVVDKNSCVSK